MGHIATTTWIVCYFLVSAGALGVRASTASCSSSSIGRTSRTNPNRCAGLQHFDELPQITIQLPIFNGAVRRAAPPWRRLSELDYPQGEAPGPDPRRLHRRDRGHLRGGGGASCESEGFDVEFIHRVGPHGLQGRRPRERDEEPPRESFIYILDADFVPGRRACCTRWCTTSPTTRSAIDTDPLGAHQQEVLPADAGAGAVPRRPPRASSRPPCSRSGRFFNFNGTAGMWRKASASRDAGGWEHDTLTEDLDLSYRAQMKGWNGSSTSRTS